MVDILTNGALATKTQVYITSGTPIALDTTSATIIQLTGASAQTIVLPDATTCFVGMRYLVINRSSQLCTVQYFDASGLTTIPAGNERELRILDVSTSNGTWDVQGLGGGSSASGANGSVQFATGASLDSDPKFVWDSTNDLLNLNGYQITALASTLLLDNQVVPVTFLTLDLSDNRFILIEYSLERTGNYQVGTLYVTNNDTIASLADTSVDTGTLGVSFSAAIDGSDVVIEYMTTNTGSNATMKYIAKKWS